MTKEEMPSGRMRKKSRSAISTPIFAAAVVVLLVIAGAGFGLYYQAKGQTSTTTVTSTTTLSTATTTKYASSATSGPQAQIAEITALAYSHWASIGEKNLSSIMSQYAPNSTLYWYVAPSSALNGTYTGLSAVNSTWTKFLSSSPSIYYTVLNFSAAVNGTSGSAKANLWYVLRNGTVTLKLPYLLTYSYVNGTWWLTGDWWGLPNSPGTTVPGVASITTTTSATATTTNSTSSSATTSSSTTAVVSTS